MASRRTHRKSRHGCRECKRRHIKCDESRPVCVNCSTSSRQCVYALASPALPGNHTGLSPLLDSPLLDSIGPVHVSGPPHSASNPAVTGRHQSPTTLSPAASQTPPSQAPSQAPSQSSDQAWPPGSSSQPPFSFDVPIANMPQLELFHHAQTQHFFPWQCGLEKVTVGVIEAAFSAPYLMNALLATAALHLSHLRPAQKSYYLHQAFHLQTHALSMFNKESTHVTPENGVILLLFSQLISLQLLYEITLNGSAMDNVEPLDRFIDYLKVFRGVAVVAREAWEVLLHSKISILFDRTSDILNSTMNDGSETAELRSTISNSRVLSPEQKQQCLEAINRLQWALNRATSASSSESCHTTKDQLGYSAVLAWPCLAESSLLGLWSKKNPESLLILAYYGVTLHYFRHDFWVFADIGPILVRTIGRHLGPGWKTSMNWPLAQIDTSTSDDQYR